MRFLALCTTFARGAGLVVGSVALSVVLVTGATAEVVICTFIFPITDRAGDATAAQRAEAAARDFVETDDRLLRAVEFLRPTQQLAASVMLGPAILSGQFAEPRISEHNAA